MARVDGTALVAGAHEALLDDPEFLREIAQTALNRFLEAEMSEHLQAGPYERSDARRGYRNGWRTRGLRTRVGALELSVPTDREGTFQTELFRRMERNEQALTLGLMELAAVGRRGGCQHPQGAGRDREVVRHVVQQEHREPLGG